MFTGGPVAISLLLLLMLTVWSYTSQAAAGSQEVLSESAETVQPNKSYAAARRLRSPHCPLRSYTMLRVVASWPHRTVLHTSCLSAPCAIVLVMHAGRWCAYLLHTYTLQYILLTPEPPPSPWPVKRVLHREDCIVYGYESVPRRLISRLQYRIPPTQITCKGLITWAGGVERATWTSPPIEFASRAYVQENECLLTAKYVQAVLE
ncbi:hypothetical protein B0H10DRAFT_1943536 [Mycena sp. CBHHK59/15]|nr:hypothetical protein B0H10DRAFT_1943536 [Mycena sp. CBHHK59/15]